MKKVLLLIISALSVLHAYAQDVDTLQKQSASISIDSLSLKLEKLQHDYDFMSCDFELYKIKTDLNDLAQDITIKTNDVLFNISLNNYNQTLYTSFSKYYDAYYALYGALKEKYESTKTLVLLKTVVSSFSDSERGVVSSSFSSITKSFDVVDIALEYFNSAIQTYKKNR